MRKIKKIVTIVTMCCFIAALSGCAMLESEFNDIKGSLIGNGYRIDTYDNYGSKVLETSGDKINISGNKVETTSYSSDGSTSTNYDLSSVITITIDGKEIES